MALLVCEKLSLRPLRQVTPLTMKPKATEPMPTIPTRKSRSEPPSRVKKIAVITVVALMAVVTRSVADSQLERLKAKASETSASLSVEESTETMSVGGRGEMEIQRTTFSIDTGARFFKMSYRSFVEGNAIENPDLLSDGGSGYGMLEPDRNWYWQGFIAASFRGISGTDIRKHQAKVRILATEGERVGYDLVFEMEAGTIVIRTVALAGREELFVSVFGENGGEELAVEFRGYPLGFNGPFDRWAHSASADIQNQGKERIAVPLDVNTDHWVLLTDHNLADTVADGQLGLIWPPGTLESAQVIHSENYAMGLDASNRGERPEQQYMLCHIVGKSWQEAREAMKALAPSAPDFITKALTGWTTK